MVRLLDLARDRGQTRLVLAYPGGEPLDSFDLYFSIIVGSITVFAKLL